MPRQIIDISVPLQNDVPADPPGLHPTIDYIDHQQSLPQILPFFPGLKAEDLPDGQGWAVERVQLSTHNGTHLDAPWHYHPTMNRGQKAWTIDREKLHGVDEAISLAKTNATSKFDETIEVAMNLGVDPRHADQMVRGVVTLPNGTGRTLRVGVFARGAKAEEAKAAGADVVGAEDLVEKVQGGNIDFDRCIATPDMMPLVGRLGKVLGPRGMMPNPKIGTVTMDVANAVKGAKGGSVEFRVEKAGIVQAGIGKASFSEEKLVQNVRALADAVAKAKPSGSKGTYIQRVAVSSTMGPGVKVEPGSLLG